MGIGDIFRLTDIKFVLAFLIFAAFFLFFLAVLFGQIDVVLGAIFSLQESDVVDVSITDEVNQEFYHHPNSSVLWVRLPGWGEKVSSSDSLKNKISDMGMSFLDYQFSSNILSSDANLTKKYFKKIDKLVISDIKRLKKQYGFTEVNIVATSLGNSNLFSIVNNNSDLFNKIVAVVPGHSLAECMWGSIRTKDIRRGFENKDVTLSKLVLKWKELAPENNIKNLKNKTVHVYLSRADKVIPYSGGIKLVQALKKVGANTIVEENKYLGHYGTIVNAYFFPDYI